MKNCITKCDSCNESKEVPQMYFGQMVYTDGFTVNYSSGDWGKIYNKDFCPKCMTDKILPYFESIGVKL